jgi:hypothetical protein
VSLSIKAFVKDNFKGFNILSFKFELVFSDELYKEFIIGVFFVISFSINGEFFLYIGVLKYIFYLLNFLNLRLNCFFID